MSEYIRALLCILLLATSIFLLSKPTALLISNKKDFDRRCMLWISLTIIIFLSHNVFLYIILGGLLLLLTAANEKNKIALFFFIVFAVPSTPVYIPAFGIVNFLFSIDHTRLLELTIFLPLFLRVIQRKDSIRLFKITSDKYLVGYLFWTILILFLSSTITDTLRFVFYVFIDIFVPYYVISRNIKNIKDLHEVIFSFVVSCTILAIIGIFEFFKGWLVYTSLDNTLGISRSITAYLSREGSLRAMASTGQTLVFGYLIVVALGFFLVIQKYIANNIVRSIWLALILAALIAPQSRGPWLGALVLILIFIATGHKVLIRFATFGTVACLTFGLLLATRFGEKIINSLPFIGTSGQFNVTYRQLLIENSLKLVLHNPFFGVPNVLNELKGMRQGEGIIDIVNTYVSVALASGLVGLILFVSVFVTVVLGIYQAMSKVKKINDELYLIGRVFFATLIAVLVMIGTVSSISFIPIVYWSVAALGLAYIQVVKHYIRSLDNSAS